jgi:heat shock protein HtpX
MNSIKTVILLGLLTGLIIFFGGVFGGQAGMVMALVVAGLMNFVSYWFSDKIVLRMHGAREIEQHEAPDLFSVVANLAQKAGMPMPRIYLVDDPAPNAFATGRGPQHAAVAVTTGILRLMNREELEGVLAHELSHIGNRDILISSIAATLAGAIMVLAHIARWGAIFGGFGGRDDERGTNPIALFAMALLAPIAATLIQLAVSRSREYEADASGAKLVGYPDGLANALRKLGQVSGKIPSATATPAVGHLYIVNAFSGRALMNIFSTHPPLEDRISRLLERR